MTRSTLPPRIYVQRESLIDSLLRDRNGLAAYSILFSLLFIHSVILVFDYLLEPKRMDADVNALAAAFPNFEYSAACWLIMHAILILIVYPATRALVTSGFKVRFLYSFLMILCAIALLVLPVFTVFHFETKYFATGVLLMEQLRLLMKMIDYVSVNQDKDPGRRKPDPETEMNSSHSHSHSHSHARNNKNNDDLVEVVVPKFSRFLYFLFSPTLLYRDDENNDYAEGERSIFSILLMTMEMGMLMHAMFQCTMSMRTRFSAIGLVPHTLPYVLDEFMICCLLGMVYLFGLQYIIMHLIQNIMANLLKFGDRRFYDDYWSLIDPGLRAKNYSRIVADWLDAHVYNPVVSKTNNKALGSLVVMFVTGAALEYIISMSNGFMIYLVTPLMITFAPIMLLHKTMNKMMDKRSKGYTFTLVMQSLTIVFFLGLIVASYTAEHYSRANCSQKHGGVKDLLIPRTFSCMSLTGLPDGLLKKLLSYLFTVR